MGDNEILILADPEKEVWNFAEEIYKKLVSNPERTRIYKMVKVQIKKFNDGEIHSRILDNVRKKTCFFIQDSAMNPQDWLVSLVFTNDALMRASAGKVNNILPYMKFSRQDRITESRTPISASIVAEIINSPAYKINRVITTDLHNPSIQGAYRLPFDNLKAYPTITDYLKKNYPDFLTDLVIVAPDAGSAPRAKSYNKKLGTGDIAIVYKERVEAGKIDKMTIIGNVKDKNALIVDDMIDTGGTLIEAAKNLKENGAKEVWACATHGVFSNNAPDRLNNSQLEKIIITDSIPQKNNGKIEVVSLVGLFSEVIHRICHSESISELYQ